MTIEKYIKTALILDLNPGLRTELQNVLKAHGIKTLKACSKGKLGYEEIANCRTRCDLVISDITLEDMTAIQFLSALRKNKRFTTTHMIITLNPDLADNLGDALQFGLSGFFLKPLSLEKFDLFLDQIFSIYQRFEGKELSLYTLTAAKVFEHRKEYKTAIAYMEELVKLGSHPQIFFDLGRLYSLIENRDAALKYFGEAVSMEPKYSKVVDQYLAEHPLPERQEEISEIKPEVIEVFSHYPSKITEPFYGRERIKTAVVASPAFSDRVTLRNMLIEMGIQDVEILAKGESVYERGKSRTLNLIVSDLKLEDMNALQLIELIRRDPEMKQTRILILWGAEFIANIEKSIELGANGYSLKPFSAESLKKSIHLMMTQEDLLVLSGKAVVTSKAAFYYYELNQLDKASELASKACAISQTDGISFLYMAMCLHKKREIQLAKNFYETAKKNNPSLDTLCSRIRIAIQSEIEKEVIAEREKQENALAKKAEQEEEERKEKEKLEEVKENKKILQPEPIPVKESVEVKTSVAIPTEVKVSDAKSASKAQIVKEISQQESTLEKAEVKQEKAPEKIEQEPIEKPIKIDDSLFELPEKKQPPKKVEKKISKKEKADEISYTITRPVASVSAKKEEEPYQIKTIQQQAPSSKKNQAELSYTMTTENKTKQVKDKDKTYIIQRADNEAPAAAKTSKAPVVSTTATAKTIPAKQVVASENGAQDEEMPHVTFDDSIFEVKTALKTKPSSQIEIKEDLSLATGGLEIPIKPLDDLPEQELKVSLGKQDKKPKNIEMMKGNKSPIVTKDENQQGLKSIIKSIGASLFGGEKKEEKSIQNINKEVVSPKPLPTNDLAKPKVAPPPPPPSKPVINLDPPKVEPWIPPPILNSMPVPKEQKLTFVPASSGAVNTLLEANKEYGKTITSLASQANLIKTRILNQDDVDNQSENTRKYFRKVGEIFSQEEMKGRIIIKDDKIRQNTGKLIQKAIKDPEGIWFEDLGKTYLQHGCVDQALKAVNDFWSKPNAKYTKEEEKTVFVLSNSVLEMREPIVELHNEIWDARNKSEKLITQAIQQFKSENVEAGMETIAEAFEADNKSLESFQKIYFSLRKAGLDDKNEEFLKKEIPPYLEKPVAREKVVDFMKSYGTDNQAYEVIKEAQKQDKNNYKFIQNLATSALKMGRLKEAIKWCEKLIEVNPNNPEAYNLLGISHKKAKDYRKAVKVYLQGLDVDPRNGKIYHNLAIAYAAMGDKKQSREAFQKAKHLQGKKVKTVIATKKTS